MGSAETAQFTDVENKFCPVSGDKVSGKNFITHEGKRYGLCCQMCDKKFMANPEKFIAQMNEQEEGQEHHHAHDGHSEH